MTTYLLKGAKPYGGDAADILLKDGRIASIGEKLTVRARRWSMPPG